MSTAIDTTPSLFDPARPYGSAWQTWNSKGWPVLVLPAGRKASPPRGFTGYDSVDASYADLHAWSEDRPTGNIAIRMPVGVVGVDIDAYEKAGKIKTGDATIARWEQETGVRFPATWRITSRGADNPSGKLLYRVPEGVRLITAEGDVELLQRHHRYAVTAPSRNDDDGGSVVRVYAPDGTEITDPADLPTPADLPELPAALVEHLRETAEIQQARKLADGELDEFMRSLPDGEPCTAMRNKTAAALKACRGGSRHDDVLKSVGGLLRVAEMGHPGIRHALAEVEQAFVAAVLDSRRGGADEATREFRRMASGGTRIAGLITAVPTAVKGCRCGTSRGPAETAAMIANIFETGEDVEDMLGVVLEVVGDDEFDAAFELATGHTVRPAAAPQAAPPVLRVVQGTAASPARIEVPAAPAPVKTPPPAPTAKPAKREAFDFRRWDLTHAGNGQRFIAFFGRTKLAFVPGANLLRSWTGSVWRTDDGAALRHLMEQMTEAMQAQARLDAAAADRLEEEAAGAVKDAKDAGDKQAEDEAKAAALAVTARNRGVRDFGKWCRDSRMGSALDQSCKSAKSNPALRIDEGEWDADPRKLNVANGTIVIDYDGNVELRPHDPDDLLTQQADVTFDPDAVSPRFDRFLTEAVPDPAVRRVLRALAGLNLIADNAKHVFPCLIGPTRSGKTTLLEVLGAVLDNAKVPALGYAGTFDLSALRPKKSSGGDPQLVWLLDRRMVWTVETADGLPLNADQVKKFSGGDRRNARDNYDRKGDVRDRAPRFVPWLASNKPPQIDGADDALFERLIPIPFPSTRPADKRVDGLAERIAKTEGSGVLRWMLEGLRDVIANPMIIRDLPDACVQLREEMFSETNPVRRWLVANTEPCPCEDSKDCVTNPEAWTSFTRQMDIEREVKVSHNSFSRALTDAKYPVLTVRIGGKIVKVRKGLRFNEEARAANAEADAMVEAMGTVLGKGKGRNPEEEGGYRI